MEKRYICPMHPEVIKSEQGTCPKCGMDLQFMGHGNTYENEAKNSAKPSYRPLIVIIGFIFLTTAIISLKSYLNSDFSLERWMQSFMAGFFLVFSGFKLLDLKGFAQAYSTYDLLASKFPYYGYIYPFIELALGLIYLVAVNPAVNIATLAIMGFSGLGVLNALRQKRKFRCACLGTIIKVPLTSVTLIEDFGMAAMALLTLII